MKIFKSANNHFARLNYRDWIRIGAKAQWLKHAALSPGDAEEIRKLFRNFDVFPPEEIEYAKPMISDAISGLIKIIPKPSMKDALQLIIAELKQRNITPADVFSNEVLRLLVVYNLHAGQKVEEEPVGSYDTGSPEDVPVEEGGVGLEDVPNCSECGNSVNVNAVSFNPLVYECGKCGTRWSPNADRVETKAPRPGGLAGKPNLHGIPPKHIEREPVPGIPLQDPEQMEFLSRGDSRKLADHLRAKMDEILDRLQAKTIDSATAKQHLTALMRQVEELKLLETVSKRKVGITITAGGKCLLNLTRAEWQVIGKEENWL
jgi:hypothetical protein